MSDADPDDHPANRELARAFLCGMGSVVDDAVDGAQAVERAELGAYDVILMDMRMPKTGKLEALKQIRAGWVQTRARHSDLYG